jgi:anti-sigma factor RsiW
MDHGYIEENNVADRYLMGKLSAEERARFEEHFVDCAQCLDRLETTEGIRAALRTVAAGKHSRPRPCIQAWMVSWVERLRRFW